jgi:hypothetical protein
MIKRLFSLRLVLIAAASQKPIAEEVAAALRPQSTACWGAIYDLRQYYKVNYVLTFRG